MAEKQQAANGSAKRFFAKLPAHIGRITFLIVILLLVVYTVSVLLNSISFFTDTAERNALLRFDTDLSKAEELTRVHYDDLYAVAERLQAATSEKAVADIIEGYIGSEQFGDLRYYNDGVTYSANGVKVEAETSGAEALSALAASMTEGCSSVYYDSMLKKDCIAFFVPIRGSAYVDGVLSILAADSIVEAAQILPESGVATALITAEGQVLTSDWHDGEIESVGGDFYEFINKLTYDKAVIADIRERVEAGEKVAYTFSAMSGRYTLALCAVDSLDGSLMLVTLSETDTLAANDTVYIQHIINLTVIAVLALAIGSVYALIYHRNTRRALDTVGTIDPAVGCANAEHFRTVVGKELQNRNHRYALAVFELRRFRYLTEHLPDEQVAEGLQHVAKVMETFCNLHETYGYLGDGKFGFLMLYENENSVKDHVRLIETVVGKHPMFGAGKTKNNFSVGVSLSTEAKHYTASELIHHAGIAADRAKGDVNKSYVFYSEKVNAERDRNDQIEMEMESALANNEFRLFLQPKYNIAEDRIDSAEALVRWFDPKTGDYRFPGEFISLFESNGFITKLDHFMYIEALKCLANAAERGEKVVPISVNVSLVTANEKDFLDFYIENKKKYRIVDGFITVEFTESFAMGDHQKIREIVNKLHDNGIRVSLDDFGSGYSSFSVIKDIPIDELKLDRLFLSKGLDQGHDETLLATVISLAKSLNMRVVQEGVETREMFESVCAKGCDVIQGYYYAKAIPQEEYRLFIGSNTSIKYKSLVK